MKSLAQLFILCLIIIFFTNCSRISQRFYYLVKHNNNYTECVHDTTLESFKETIERSSPNKFYDNNSLKLLKTGEIVLQRMFELANIAQKEICVDQYIFRNDEIGKEFMNILEEKARKGVKVRVIIDKIGSFGPSMYFVKKLKFSKMKTRFYNPVFWWSIIKINNRDHNKLIIVDSDTAIISGLGKEYKFWRDIGVEINGPVVYDIQRSFESSWTKAGYGWFGKEIPVPFLNSIKLNFDSIFLKETIIDESIKKRKSGNQTARLMYTTLDFGSRDLFESMLKAINSSTKYLYITNAYFLPNSMFRKSLINAVRRGVDVRILLPQKTDLPMLRRTSHFHYSELLSGGIKIFELRDKVLHAKYMLADDRWATIGSTNILDRAFFMNIETNIETIDYEFTCGLKQIFLSDLKMSDQIKIEEWKKRSLWKKFSDLLILPSLLLY